MDSICVRERASGCAGERPGSKCSQPFCSLYVFSFSLSLFRLQALEQLALVQRQSAMAGFYKAAEPSVMDVLSQRRQKEEEGGKGGKGVAR